jgi:hypothetical protein
MLMLISDSNAPSTDWCGTTVLDANPIWLLISVLATAQ